MSLKNELHQLLDALPEESWPRARRLLQDLAASEPMAREKDAEDRQLLPSELPSDILFREKTDIEELIARGGIVPIERLRDFGGDVWPKDDSVDEFVATIRRWRREGGHA